MLKALLVGNLGGDPELRYAQDGQPMLRFNVASNDRKKDADGEWREATAWVQVTVFGNRAETLVNYLHKGMKVYADGRLDARPWTDQQGNIRAGLSMIANDVQFMSPREDGNQGYQQGYQQGGQPEYRPQPQQGYQQPPPQQRPAPQPAQPGREPQPLRQNGGPQPQQRPQPQPQRPPQQQQRPQPQQDFQDIEELDLPF
jgi:single-strand DNA-binding protein